MIQERFKIQPKQLFNIDNGKPDKVITEVIIRILQWSVYDPMIGAYIEKICDDGSVYYKDNQYIPVPENWGIDNMVVVQAFADLMKIELILEDELNIIEEPKLIES